MGHVKLHSQTFKTIESRMQILLPLKLQSLSVRWTLRDVFYHLHAQSCTALCDPTAYAAQASLSLEFSRQGYWSRFLCLPPGDLPNAGIEPRSPALPVDSPPPRPQPKAQGKLALYCDNLILKRIHFLPRKIWMVVLYSDQNLFFFFEGGRGAQSDMRRGWKKDFI